MAKRVNKPNPELVKYIEKHLAKGFHIKHVKRKLAEVGHPIEAIEDAAAYVLESQPKKKHVPKFMIIYGLILILLIAGAIWFFWFKATQQIEYVDTVEDIKKNASLSGMSQAQLFDAAAAGNMDACKFMKSHSAYYGCLNKVWEQDDCTFEVFKGQDRDDCLSELSVKKNNLSMCVRVGGEKGDDCMEALVAKNDLSFCNGYPDCVEAFALAKNNDDACRALTTGAENCFDTIALNLKDSSLCDEGSSECILEFLDNDAEILVYYTKEVPRRGWSGSLIDIALETGIVDICGLIPDEDMITNPGIGRVNVKSICFFRSAFEKKDASICSNMPVQMERNICKDVVGGDCTSTANHKAICALLEV